MKIFVGYGFNDRDRWVRDLVLPLIHSFGFETETGEGLHGEVITDAVQRRREKCQAMLAFATRRTALEAGGWTTHRWVLDELAHALAIGIPALEVREQDVDDQGGIAGDRQRIDYDPAARDLCLVEIAQVLGRWRQDFNPVRLQLLPQETVKEILGIYKRPGFSCVYRLLQDGAEGEERPARLLPVGGGMFVQASRVPRDALIQVELRYQNHNWVSGYESVDAVGITLQGGE
jgi:hypothetical protein